MSTDFVTLEDPTPPIAYTNYLRRLKLGMNGPLVNTFGPCEYIWTIQAIFEFWTSQDIAENRFLHYSSETGFFSYLILEKEIQKSV